MKRVVLGQITVPSGALVLVDPGALALWTHDRAPDDDDQVDLVISGPEGAEAGRRFDRDWDPERIHDVPREEADELAAAFIAFCERQHLDATIALAARRDTHRERLARALSRGGGGYGFLGSWAVAVPGLPPGEVLDLVGEPIEEGPDEGRWRRVWLEVNPGLAVARSEELAQVMGDQSSLLVVDAAALGGWEHEASLDGLADCVFWGRDARQAADALAAPALELRTFGWTNVPEAEARELAKKVDLERTERGMRFSLDLRPHSHHFRALELMRESALGTAALEVGGARLCAFATTWGDGVFPVWRDLGPGGELVRVRVEFTEDVAPTIH